MEFNSKATCCVISKWAKVVGDCGVVRGVGGGKVDHKEESRKLGGGDGTLLNLNCGGSYVTICVCQNPCNSYPIKDEFYLI